MPGALPATPIESLRRRVLVHDLRRAAGIAVALAFAAGAAQGATIAADGTICTLVEAVASANADADLDGCVGVGTYGADQIFLDADALLTAPAPGASDVGGAFAGLPDVTTEITVTARGASLVERNLSPCHESGSSELRLWNVAGATGDLTLEGLTLADGCVASPASTPARGGAIHVQGGRVELDGVTIQGGTVIADDGPAEGAALYATGAVVEVRNSFIAANLADTLSGGARGAIYVTGGLSALAVSRTAFVGNVAVSHDGFVNGGALNVDAPNATLADTLFEGNAAEADSSCNGGALYVGEPVALVERVVFRNNRCDSVSANATGGAIYISGATNDVEVLRDCLFEGNVAASQNSLAFGGALHFESPLGTLERCAFVANSAEGGSTATQGFDADGGAISIYKSVDRIANVTFAGNSAVAGNATINGNGGGAHGGAIFLIFGESITTVTQVTAANNQAAAGLGAGGGLDGGAAGGALFVSDGASVDLVDNSLFDANDGISSGSTFAEDCGLGSGAAVLSSGGHNWVKAPGTCPFGGVADVVGVDPGLGALGNQGCMATLPGTICVPTIPLEESSLALDWGSCIVANSTLDARGAPRPVDLPSHGNTADGCDVGAFERQTLEPVLTSLLVDGFESGDTSAWSATLP